MQSRQPSFCRQCNVQIIALDRRQHIKGRLPVDVVDNLLAKIDVRTDLLRIPRVQNVARAGQCKRSRICLCACEEKPPSKLRIRRVEHLVDQTADFGRQPAAFVLGHRRAKPLQHDALRAVDRIGD